MRSDQLEHLEQLLEIPYEQPEDIGNNKTHIVNPPKNLHIWQPGMTTQEVVDIARATTQHLVALCGYTWIPKFNPDLFPACDNCVRIAGELMRDAGE